MISTINNTEPHNRTRSFSAALVVLGCAMLAIPSTAQSTTETPHDLSSDLPKATMQAGPETTGAQALISPDADEPYTDPAMVRLKSIRSQVIDTIAGVSIMQDPTGCGEGWPEVRLTVQNVKNSKGTIVVDLHNDTPEDFLVWDRVVLRVRAKAVEGETNVCVPLLQAGQYALAVYHDKNSNTEFDKNFLGIPSERFGMSNDPKFGLSQPDLADVLFEVPPTGVDALITLRKAGDVLGGN